MIKGGGIGQNGGGGGGGGNIDSINGETGPSITIQAGSGISVDTSNNIIDISANEIGAENLVVTSTDNTIIQNGSSTYDQESKTINIDLSSSGSSSITIADQVQTDTGYSSTQAVGVRQMKIYNSKRKFNPSSWGFPQAKYVTTQSWDFNQSGVAGLSSVVFADELGKFCAVGAGGIATSFNGQNWTAQTPASAVVLRSICWSPELKLFCAIAISGAGNRVATSPDGENWTSETSDFQSTWTSICWSPELKLFCAVADSGTTQVITSPDGKNWTAQTITNTNAWTSICWSPELKLFCAVAISGAGNRVMTSPDGNIWTIRTSAADNGWRSVCWAPWLNLFIAVASSGTSRVMVSPDGIIWSSKNSANDAQLWRSVCALPALNLLCAVADSGSDNRAMFSTDGDNWVSGTTFNAAWSAVCPSTSLGLFCGVAISTGSVMLSQSAWSFIPAVKTSTSVTLVDASPDNVPIDTVYCDYTYNPITREINFNLQATIEANSSSSFIAISGLPGPQFPNNNYLLNLYGDNIGDYSAQMSGGNILIYSFDGQRVTYIDFQTTFLISGRYTI